MNQKPRVLVIDDDEAYCQAVKDVIEPYGADVMMVHSVEAAKALLEGLKTDLLVVDLALAGLDGLMLISWLRSRPVWGEIPIIVASGMTLRAVRDAAVGAGASACISKPFSARELRSVLRQFLPLVQTSALSPRVA